MVGSIDIKSRPIRLGMIVDPKDKQSVKTALLINSSLWGGMFNPIIPIYKRIPKNWKIYKKNAKYKDILYGYLEAFDVDIIVNCTKSDISFLNETGREIIKHTEIFNILGDFSEDYPSYGLGILEVLREIFEEYYRYETKYKPKIIFPDIGNQHELFFMSVFGKIPENLTKLVRQNYENILNLEYPKVKNDNYLKIVDIDNWFPRRIGLFKVTTNSRQSWDRSYLFFLDPEKVQDILDFWNLRALGKQVLAVPNGLKDSSEFMNYVKDFVTKHYQQSRYNKDIFFHVNALNSRSVSPEDVKNYMQNLDLSKDSKNGSIYALQTWYPEIWDEWSRKHNGSESDSVYSEETSIDIQNEGSIRFKPLIPKICSEYSLFNKPRLVNEIKFRIYGRDLIYAQALPDKYGNAVLRSVSGLGGMRGDWRISRDGVCKMINSNISEVWDIPAAKDVFLAWLKDMGWNAKISPPGILSYQIFERLGGLTHILANEQLLNIFEDMNKNHTEKPVGELKQRFPNLEILLDKGMLTLGYKFKCNTCMRYSWYKLSKLNNLMQCPKCLSDIKTLGNIESGSWYYKPTGPFSIADYANGAYSVLLAVNVFLQFHSRLDITPVYSFEMENTKNNILEADFGFLWNEHGFHGTLGGSLFGECKTFGDFEKKDFQKMATLAKEFPGAVIAFCTLKENLNSNEIKEITKIAKKGRKYWKNDRPINPVLILTRKELFSLHGMPYCWENIDNDKYRNNHDFLDIVDASQQIYLGVKSWREDWYDKFDAKLKKKQNSVTQESVSI